MSFLKNLISGFVGNYGDDVARSAANQADDALRAVASQSDDLGRIVSRGKNAGNMPETQQMLKNLLSENVADQIYPRVDDDYFNMFTNQEYSDIMANFTLLWIDESFKNEYSILFVLSKF